MLLRLIVLRLLLLLLLLMFGLNILRLVGVVFRVLGWRYVFLVIG